MDWYCLTLKEKIEIFADISQVLIALFTVGFTAFIYFNSKRQSERLAMIPTAAEVAKRILIEIDRTDRFMIQESNEFEAQNPRHRKYLTEGNKKDISLEISFLDSYIRNWSSSPEVKNYLDLIEYFNGDGLLNMKEFQDRVTSISGALKNKINEHVRNGFRN